MKPERRSSRVIVVAAVCLCLQPASRALGWGLKTHRFINETAIEALSGPLREHFELHRERLAALGVEPDTVLRARQGRTEAVRHFIDLDLYGEPPFSELPRSFRLATKKFGRDTVLRRGTLPWTLLDLHRRLIREMREGRWRAAVGTAGHAGHYVADAHMPLHTTDNHDGQRTGNRGIHRAVERGLVDRRLEVYRARVGRMNAVKPTTIDADRIFAMLTESYSRVDSLLRADRAARRRGSVETREYFDALDESAGGLLAGQMAAAARMLGVYWVSAWEAAGRPAPPSERSRREPSPAASYLDSLRVTPYDPSPAWVTVKGSAAGSP